MQNQASALHEGQPADSRASVLLVADRPAHLLALRTLLGEMGLDLVEAAAADAPRLLLESKKESKKVPSRKRCRGPIFAGFAGTLLVALTGYGQEEDRRRTREAGFDAHLVKPADLTILQRLLATSER